MTFVKAAVLALGIFLYFPMFAQDFEGKIDYEISYEELPEEMKAYEGMLPKEFDLLIKGDKVKMTQPTAMGGKSIIISDQSENKSIALIDAMGYKLAVDQDLPKESPTGSIEYLKDIKEIAGLQCKKAILTSKNGTKTTVWFTDEIQPLPINPGFKSLKGLPMEFETMHNGANANIIAISVKEQEVPETEFEIPEGYDKVTEEEFQELIKQGR